MYCVLRMAKATCGCPKHKAHSWMALRGRSDLIFLGHHRLRDGLAVTERRRAFASQGFAIRDKSFLCPNLLLRRICGAGPASAPPRQSSQRPTSSASDCRKWSRRFSPRPKRSTSFRPVRPPLRKIRSRPASCRNENAGHAVSFSAGVHASRNARSGLRSSAGHRT
jgi:hypothetical protein